MFDAVFKGMVVFEAAVWFIGGLIMTGTGAAFFLDSFFFRRRARRVQARVVGMIGNKNSKTGQGAYTPVYEYTTETGERLQVKASSSGSLAKYMPETYRDVLVDPEDPYDVRGPVPVGMIAGFVIAATGGGLFTISYSVNENVLLVALVAALLLVFQGARLFARHRRDIPMAREMFREKLRTRKKEKYGGDYAHRVLSYEDHVAALRRQDKSAKIWMPVIIVIGAGLLAFGIWRGQNLATLMDQGLRTDGKIVRIESERGSGPDSNIMYYSIAAFKTSDGRTMEFRDSIGASHAIDKKGDGVKILYMPSAPEDAMIDRGLWNWALPGGSAVLGFLLLWLGAKSLAGVFNRRAL